MVLIERHVEGPMKVVLDGPVAAHGVGEGVGPKDPRRDVGAPLELNLFAALSPALDHCDGGELGKAECARIGALGGHPVGGWWRTPRPDAGPSVPACGRGCAARSCRRWPQGRTCPASIRPPTTKSRPQTDPDRSG